MYTFDCTLRTLEAEYCFKECALFVPYHVILKAQNSTSFGMFTPFSFMFLDWEDKKSTRETEKKKEQDFSRSFKDAVFKHFII